jgi:hypothetical protein
LQAWFRADVGVFKNVADSQAAASDGDPIARWSDSSPGHDAVQGDASRAPMLRKNQVHGLPAVCFDAEQFLSLSQSVSLRDHTIFAVTRPDYTRQVSNILLGSDENYLLATYVVGDAESARLSYYTGTLSVDSPQRIPPAVWHVEQSDRVGATWIPRLNGEALALDTVATSEPLRFSSFGNFRGTYFYNGCVAEVIVYDRGLSDDERDRVRTYLATRFGIAGVAPTRVMFAGGPRGNYNMTPATVSLLDGDPATGRPPTLVTAFRNGPGHIGVGQVLAMSSKDGGATWTAPVVAAQDPMLDVRTNIGMIRLTDGTLLLPVEKEDQKQPSPDLAVTVVGTFLTRSRDGGTTWSEPQPVETPAGYDALYAYGTLIERADGTLIMPAYAWKLAPNFWDSVLLASSDHGETWTLRGVIARGTPQLEFSETAIAYRGDALFAVIGEDIGSHLWVASSKDDGRTWNEPQDFDTGNSPALLPLTDGRLLLAYALRPGVSGTYARIVQTDAAGNFDTAATADQAAYPISATGHASLMLGYPAPVELPDGRIFVDYWSELMGDDRCHSRIWSRTFDLASLGP